MIFSKDKQLTEPDNQSACSYLSRAHEQ